jgi:uncharacterized protein (TIRG00374 family)
VVKVPCNDNLSGNNTVLKNWKFWLGIIISVVALFFTLRNVPFDAFVSALATANVAWFVPAFLALMFVLTIRAVRWATLMGNAPVGITFHAQNIGYMVNMVLPLRLGEIVRAFVIGQRTPVNTPTALSSIVVERLLDLAAVVLMFVGFAQFIPMDATLARAATVSAVLVVLLILVIGTVIWQSARMERLIETLLQRFNVPNTTAWTQRLRQFTQGFRLINTPQRFLIVLGCTVVTWLGNLACAYFTMAAFFPPRLDQAGLMLVAANLGGAAPSAPGGLGIVQGFAKLALVLPFGLDEARATALAFVWSLGQQLILIVLGLVGMVRIGLSFSQLQVSSNTNPPPSSSLKERRT